MPERGAEIRAVLATLVDGKHRLGAAVVSRDGIAVASRMARPVSEDTFAAMMAAILGAGDAAIQEWSDDRPQRATLEGKDLRVIAQVLDKEFFLAVAAPVGEDHAAAAIELDAAVAKLRSILKSALVYA